MTILCSQPACQTTAGCQCGWSRAIKRAEMANRAEKIRADVRPHEPAALPTEIESLRHSRAELYKAFDNVAELLACALDEFESENGIRTDPADPHWSVQARSALAATGKTQEGE